MTVFQNERINTPTGFKVKPMSYAEIEEVAEGVWPLFPKRPGERWAIDTLWTLEQMLPEAGYKYRIEESALLDECAAFTVPDEGLVVLREDVYEGLLQEKAFSRSTVVHEASHIILAHAATLQRGPIGAHRFCEDSEWQAKALTAALMMPLQACAAARSADELAHLCGTSVKAATFRLTRLVKHGIIKPKGDT